jgi:aspartate kinase
MLVFKFGSASLKGADNIIHIANTVKKHAGEQLLIVVSAIGETTAMLEKLTTAYVEQADDIHSIYEKIRQQHDHLLTELFEPSHPVFNEVANTFVEIDWMIEDEPQDSYDFIYDQVVSVGELVSSRIVTAYLNNEGIKSQWLDARGYIHTDNTYRSGIINRDKTHESIKLGIPPLLEKGIIVTQVALGGTSENFTTTLGAQGSDHAAAIFAEYLGTELRSF